MKSNSSFTDTGFRAGAWIVLGVTLVAVLWARTHLCGVPLERDEGEYAYEGQLLLHGIWPYKLAYTMKLPGTAAAYGLIMSIFGQSISGIHLGLALVNLIAIGLVFLLGHDRLGKIGGIVSASFYSVLSLMPHVLGTAAHATHFVVLFAVAGTLVLSRSLDRHSSRLIFASGLLFGIAFLMKQPGIFFVGFASLYLFAHDRKARLGSRSILSRNLVFILGAAVPSVVTGLLLWGAGVFEKFWFWTVTYATQYGSQVSAAEGFQMFTSHFAGVLGTAWPIWLLGLVGLIALAIDPTLRGRAWFLITFAMFSALAVCPGLYFRPHYFILFLPALSLMCGSAIVAAINLLRAKPVPVRLAVLGMVAVILGFPLWSERDFFFELPVSEANRLVNGTNPFPESIRIADYIRSQSDPGDKIAVLGSEPEIYFYSQRLSATGYIYTYSLMEPQPYAHQMQQEMIREIEAARPRFLVLVGMSKSWSAGRDSDQTILKWANSYCESGYEKVGLINISEPGTDYYFSNQLSGVTPTADYILIYRRKT